MFLLQIKFILVNFKNVPGELFDTRFMSSPSRSSNLSFFIGLHNPDFQCNIKYLKPNLAKIMAHNIPLVGSRELRWLVYMYADIPKT